MKKDILMISLFFCLFSCKEIPKSTSLDDIFRKAEALVHGNSINPSDYLMGAPVKILLVDSTLITLDYASESFFHVFNIDKNEYLGNFGSKGLGPNEFLQPFSLTYFSPLNFLSYDLFDKSLKKINVEALKKGEIIYEKTLSFNSISNIAVLPTKDKNYLCFGMYESNMFKIKDSLGNDIGSFMDFPLEEKMNRKDIDNRNLAMAYQGTLAMNPSKDKFVYASSDGTILGIYSIFNNSITQDFLLIYDYPQFTIDNSDGGTSSPMTKDAISGFLDMYVTDKYIYALYSGKNIVELRDQTSESEDIYVFDWNGRCIKHYNLDIPIKNIAVLPNNKKIYAIANNPEPTLVEFKVNL